MIVAETRENEPPVPVPLQTGIRHAPLGNAVPLLVVPEVLACARREIDRRGASFLLASFFVAAHHLRSAWERDEQEETSRLPVTCVDAKQISKIMDASPRYVLWLFAPHPHPHVSMPSVCSYETLLQAEVQLQQLLIEGKCFHILLLFEDVKVGLWFLLPSLR